MDPNQTNSPQNDDQASAGSQSPVPPQTEHNPNVIPPIEETHVPFDAQNPVVNTPPQPEVNNPPVPEVTTPEVSNPALETPTPDQTTPPATPPSDTSSQKPKMKILGAIAGVVLLVGSVIAGVVLVQNSQETREKAAGEQISNASVQPTTVSKGQDITVTGNIDAGNMIHVRIFPNDAPPALDAGKITTSGQSVTFNTSALPAGTSFITVRLQGQDANGVDLVPNVAQDFTVTVNDSAPTLSGLSVSPNPVTVGQSVTINGSISTGKIHVRIFPNDQTPAIDAGKLTSSTTSLSFDTNLLPAGTTFATVRFQGQNASDQDLNGLNGLPNVVQDIRLDVSGSSSGINISGAAVSPNPVPRGQNVTINGSITSGKIHVRIFPNDAPPAIDAGKLTSTTTSLTFDTDLLPANATFATVRFQGQTADDRDLNGQNGLPNVVQDVQLNINSASIPTLSNISVSPNPAQRGQMVTIGGSISTGKIHVRIFPNDQQPPIDAGKLTSTVSTLTFDTNQLPAGTTFATVRFQGQTTDDRDLNGQNGLANVVQDVRLDLSGTVATRCTSLEVLRGGSVIYSTTGGTAPTINAGDQLQLRAYCYTTDATESFDQVKFEITPPGGTAQIVDRTATRDASKDQGSQRFYVSTYSYTPSVSGSFTIKAWGHAVTGGWKGQ